MAPAFIASGPRGTGARSTLQGPRIPLIGATMAAFVLLGALLLVDSGPRGRARVADARASASAVAKERAVRAYGRLPLRFEANRGQTDPRVKFIARGVGYTLFLTPQEAVLSLRQLAHPATSASSPRHAGRSASVPAISATVRMRLVGGNPRAPLAGLAPLPGKTNYLIGRNPQGWRTGVPGYASAVASGVYPGIAVVYHGRQGHLEYDFRVAPGADPGRIALAFSGARSLSLDAAGNLVLDTAAGALREQRPVVYQQFGGRRHTVSGSFVIRHGHRVSFRLGSYDRSRPLVIDPALVYSTYLGEGSGQNLGLGGGTISIGNVIAVDSFGAAYITVSTQAIHFRTTPGAYRRTKAGLPGDSTYDAVVTKLSPEGALVYSTYLGGSSDDFANGIAVDSGGRAYLTGQTLSADFPTTATAYQATAPGSAAAFVSVLNPSGSRLIYSTYLGGTTGASSGQGIALDSTDHAYVTGFTGATDFPTAAPPPFQPFQNALSNPTSGNQDAFVAKLDPSAPASTSSLIYSTYLGGGGSDQANAIAVDATGDAYVGGLTNSGNATNNTQPDFPLLNQYEGPTLGIAAGHNAGFVTKLNATGSALDYSTYLGGSSGDWVNAIAIDPAGGAYVTGQTKSQDFPTLNAFQPRDRGIEAGTNDAFVTKLDPGASGRSSLKFSSFLGGAGDDIGTAIAVAPTGSIVVAGEADGPNPPATPGSFPTVDPLAPVAAGGDAFLSVVKPDGSGLSFSTYLGGGGEDAAFGVAVDRSGNMYLAGGVISTDFPTRNAFQTQNFGLGSVDDGESFVAKVAPGDPTAPLVTGLNRHSGPAGTSLVITGHGFTGASAVQFGSVAASSFTVDSDGQITATVPAGASGAVIVAVTTPRGTSPPNPIASFSVAQGTWNLTGSLPVPLYSGQAATLLSDGRVLVAGGTAVDQGTILAVTEVYDPATGTWSPTGSMGTVRNSFTATLLPDGRVLVAGGMDQNGNALPSAELYDPASGTWSPTGSMATARANHTATLLPDGKVLVAGGLLNVSSPLASAELYDPATGTWSPAGTMADPRTNHTATLLASGKVLVAGGRQSSNGTPLASAELYDPAANSWATTGALNTARVNHTATLLSDGRVLVVGGNGFTGAMTSVEIYDPASGEFTSTASMADRRAGPAAALLPDGTVLIAGGSARNIMNLDTAEVYDPATGQWSSAGFMNRYRSFYDNSIGPSVFAVPLADGTVLVGGDSADAGATTELYTPSPSASAPTSPGSSPAPGAQPAPLVPPVVTHYRLTNNPFVVRRHSTARTKHKHGTTFKYTLSEAATVKIVISQRSAGRRHRKRCVAPSKKLRRAKRCMRIMARGTLTHTSRQGANEVAFSGRLGTRALTPGSYQATLTATDASMLSSRPQTLRFKVVRR